MDWTIVVFQLCADTFNAEYPGQQKPAIGKVIAPKALFWFRWAALGTIITGLIVSYLGICASSNDFRNWKRRSKNNCNWNWYVVGIIMAYNVWFVIWPNQKKR